MATITRPITRSIISTTQWGVPITDQVNQNTTDIATINGKITPAAWTDVTFANGWVNFTSGGYRTMYRKIGDIVYIRGGAASGTLVQPIFTLPAGFRPPSSLQMSTPSWAAVVATVEITADGRVCALATSDNRYVGLSNIAFSVTA